MELLLDNQSLNKSEFYHVVQPIVNLVEKRIHGFEFLLRSKQIQNPEKLFGMAEKNHQLNELDKISVYKIFETVASTKGALDEYQLFINVYPSTMVDPDFLKSLKELADGSNIHPNSVVFEINEAEEILDIEFFKETVVKLKQMGFLISLDDIGKGQANMKNLIEINPNIAKLDLYFSEDLAFSPKKQDFIYYFHQFLGRHAKIILEGLEKEEDLQAAKQLGVSYGQGYYLGKPQPLEFYVNGLNDERTK
ncbi:EAL domain-containing protein [Caldifermentibacillus hisashii]|uniref:EAL domain-containing protein n=1 Tax=Caldifermentibacillus hisashii TaxID=996558 RepID=UPI0031B7A616